MIVAVIALGAVVAVLALLLAMQWELANRERESWAAERQALVNRVVARHTGEVLALDHEAHRPKVPKEPVEHLDVVGLS